MNFRARILGVLVVLLALNVLFVLTVLWAFLVFLPTLVAGTVIFLQEGVLQFDVLRFPVSLPVAAALVAVFLGGQLYVGYSLLLSGTRPPSSDSDTEVSRLVTRLAADADIPAPDVRVVDDETASCYTVGRFGAATIVVTTGLVEQLDRDELAAVLAHEVAHVANRDVTLMTVTTLFLELATKAYRATGLLRRAVTDPESLSEQHRLLLRFCLPLAVLTGVFVAPLLWVFPRVAGWATRTLSHTREFAADTAAAHLTGNPLALATALLSLQETTTPQTDLRASRTQALCIVPREPVTGRSTASVPTPDDGPDDPARMERVDGWLDGATPDQAGDSHTHPAVETRVRRLRELATELEGTA